MPLASQRGTACRAPTGGMLGHTQGSLFIDIINNAGGIISQQKTIDAKTQDIYGPAVYFTGGQKTIDEVFRSICRLAILLNALRGSRD